MRIPSLRPLPVVLLASAALCLSAGGGAVAGSMITGKQIKDGSITAKDLSKKTVAGLRGATGPAGPAGTAGPAGAPGMVRAYGLVDPFGLTVTRQSGGLTVTSPSDGTVCVTVPGVPPSSTSALATPDFSNDSTTSTHQAYVEVASSNGGCPASAFKVITFRRAADTGMITYSGQGFYFFVA